MNYTIIINSKSNSRIGRVLSNESTRYPFKINGKIYYSVRMAHEMIKFPPNSIERNNILNLSKQDAEIMANELGKEAKKDYVYWDGKRFQYNSVEHQMLIASFIREKFYQNKKLMEILLTTENRILDYYQNNSDIKNSILTKETFLFILKGIRKDVISNLYSIKRGQKIGSTLNECSICTAPHLLGTCVNCFEIATSGYHPEEGIEICSIAVCTQNSKDECIFGYSREITGEKKKKKEKEHPFTVWDRKEHVYSEQENSLMALRPNETLGGVLGLFTICPVGNGTCGEYFAINVNEFGIENNEIMVCPLSIKSGDDCPLNK